MSLLVIGSIAYDSVTTVVGSRERALGGSATFFSIAASYFTSVGLVAVIGDDFKCRDLEILRRHDIELSGLERRPGESFRWEGVYDTDDLNKRITLDTRLNVFEEFDPVLSTKQKETEFLFLANIDPSLQLQVLEQFDVKPKFVGLDTMDFWITNKKDTLKEVVKRVDVLFVDESEVKVLAGQSSVVKSARMILGLGPTFVVVKRGDRGVIVFGQDSVFSVPAFPVETVVDPTGAGDSFAGGFVGYLAACGYTEDHDIPRATIFGCMMGAFAVESFSIDRLDLIKNKDIEFRFGKIVEMIGFEDLATNRCFPFVST